MTPRSSRTATLLCALALSCNAQAQLTSAGAQLWHLGSTGIGYPIEAGAGFGTVVAAGDFNCDGYEDAAIGIPRANLNSAVDAGRVLVIYANPNGSGLSATNRQFISQAGAGLPSDEASGENFGRALAAGDFDGNGCDDLAIGVPYDNIGAASGAGAVHILKGDPAGLSLDADDYLRQGIAGVVGQPSTGDFFGFSLAAGYFNGDAYEDLAIGAPGEDIGSGNSTVTNAGAVHIAYGSFFGLDVEAGSLLRRGSGLPGSPVASEQLGSQLAAGALDTIAAGDELVIGVPLYDPTPALANAGAVIVVRDVDGTPAATLIDQETNAVPGISESGDLFGNAVAIGDFDNDGLGEIVIGSPGEDQNAPYLPSVGAVAILEWQSGTSVSLLQSHLAPETIESGDTFGSALAIGDFDGDGIDDLAIGAELEDSAVTNSGTVHVLYGNVPAGITLAGRQIFTQLVDVPGAEDRYGSALAAGRFTSGAGMDLLIGAPYNTVSGSQTGSANVIYSAD